MNTYKIVPLIILLLSCENIFEEDDINYIELDTYEEKVNIVNGIYSKLVDVHDTNYFFLLARSDDIFFWQERRSIFEKDRVTGVIYSAISSPANMGNSYTAIIGSVYQNLYKAIMGANSVIAKLFNEKEETLLGEVYLLRAYCYFKLARFFGTPPIVDNIDVDFHLHKPTYKEVYEFIESDLLKAIKLLPDRPENARIPGETPHEGTAKALLAEVYLSMAGYPVNDYPKYAEAAKLAGEVINAAEGYGYRLLYDFADLWDSQNKYNSEDIFSLHFAKNDISKQNEISFMYLINTKITDEGMPLVVNEIYLLNIIKPDYLFFTRFPLNYRKRMTMVTGTYYKEQITMPDTMMYILNYVLFDPFVYPNTYLQNIHILKWLDWDLYRQDEFSYKYDPYTFHFFGGLVRSDKTLYLLRYAQTLLTFAEAKARIGELDQSALDALNMVRRRSYNVDINSPSAYDINAGISPQEFIDTVIAERSFELFYEPDGRWFDIIRLDLKDHLEFLAYVQDTVPSKLLTSDWYFYEVPQEDRWINKNLE